MRYTDSVFEEITKTRACKDRNFIFCTRKVWFLKFVIYLAIWEYQNSEKLESYLLVPSMIGICHHQGYGLEALPNSRIIIYNVIKGLVFNIFNRILHYDNKLHRSMSARCRRWGVRRHHRHQLSASRGREAGRPRVQAAELACHPGVLAAVSPGLHVHLRAPHPPDLMGGIFLYGGTTGIIVLFNLWSIRILFRK